MPTTSTIGEGSMLFSFSTGDSVRQIGTKAVQPTASNYSAVVGLLPNVELGLSFLTPSLLNGNISDRSGGGKWAILPERRNGFSFAIGSTDVQGTNRRQTEYATIGQNWGALNVYASYGHGLLKGSMEGASYNFGPEFAVMAEHMSAGTMAGLKGRFLKRFTLAAAIDKHGAPFLGAGYAVPLKSPELPMPSPVKGKELQDKLANRLATLGRGAARVEESDGVWAASYDDVEARNPVPTFARALRLLLDASPTGVKRLRLTVRRYGFDLVTLEGTRSEIHSFCNGWESAADFLASVRLDDGAPKASKAETETKAGETPGALVTFAPGVQYSLGIVDKLPNKEFVRADGIARLPANLLAAAATDVTFNNSLDNSSTITPTQLALYRTDRLAPGLWSMAGVDHSVNEPWAATWQLSYYLPILPLNFKGSASRPFESTFADQHLRFSLEGSLDFYRGEASLFVRRERFLAGDIGNTIGLTRRFGETWLTLQNIDTRDEGVHVRRTGVLFQIPLPGAAVDAGPVRFATASTADFSYLVTPHASPTFGLGVARPNLLSPTADLTARGQLTASFIRQQIESLRTP